MSEFIIRKASEHDAYGVEYVASYSWLETYKGFMPDDYLLNRVNNIDTRKIRTEQFISEHDNYYVAVVNNKIVGILYFNIKDNIGYLEAIYVLKEYQGLGIGKTFFKMALKYFIDNNINDMYLECLKGNPTINFYKKYDGVVVDEIDFPISDFSVKALVIEFKNIGDIYERIN